MMDNLKVDEEERLRERLKAKQKEQKERRSGDINNNNSDSNHSPNERDSDINTKLRSHSPDAGSNSKNPRNSHRRHYEDRRGGNHHHHNQNCRGGGGRGRDRYYDDRREAGPYRGGDDWRDIRSQDHLPPPPQGLPSPPPQQDIYGRGPPPPLHRNYERYTDENSINRGGSVGRDLHYGQPAPARRGGDFYEDDRYGGGGYRRRGSHSVSRSRSRGRSRSRSFSDDMSSRSGDSRGRHHRRYQRRRSTSRRSPSRSRSRSYSPSDAGSVSQSSFSSVDSNPEQGKEREGTDMAFSKDQRTVFVTQLVQRTVERDIKKYFSKEHGLKVNEVILLRDKRTGRHKGCAYVTLRRMEDVPKAVALSNIAPDFQRFPILVKASEAEKNYVAALSSNQALTAAQMGRKIQSGPFIQNGKLCESQKAYVGSLDPSVTQEHLFVLFSQFGQLEKVSLQIDQNTGMSKGFAFLSFRDPKEANLAIQTMANQVLAGRPMKTGWAVNQIASIPGAQVVTSQEFPPDASIRATNAYKVLAQLTLGVPVSQVVSPSGSAPVAPAAPVVGATTIASVSRVPTVAEARAILAASSSVSFVPVAPRALPVVPAPAAVAASHFSVSGAIDDPSKVKNADKPSQHILIRNMFDKDQETEPGWENDVKEEFEEECSKFGKITDVKVMSKEIGGKVYASFDTVEGAQNCASSLAGRWFDKRRLQVEFVQEGDIPAL